MSVCLPLRAGSVRVGSAVPQNPVLPTELLRVFDRSQSKGRFLIGVRRGAGAPLAQSSSPSSGRAPAGSWAGSKLLRALLPPCIPQEVPLHRPTSSPVPPTTRGGSLPSPRQAAALCERAQQHLSHLESHKGTAPIHVIPFPAAQRSVPKAFLIALGEIEALGHLTQPGSGAPVPLAPGATSPC